MQFSVSISVVALYLVAVGCLWVWLQGGSEPGLNETYDEEEEEEEEGDDDEEEDGLEEEEEEEDEQVRGNLYG